MFIHYLAFWPRTREIFEDDTVGGRIRPRNLFPADEFDDSDTSTVVDSAETFFAYQSISKCEILE